MSFLQTSKKNIFLDWDFFNHLAPDMQYETNELFCILNCICPTIHIHFFMKYKLNGRHTFLSNLWTFSVPYILVILIFLVKKYIPHALVYKFLLGLLSRSSNDSIKISFLCEGSQIAHWRKHLMSRNQLLKPEISPLTADIQVKEFCFDIKILLVTFCCKG